MPVQSPCPIPRPSRNIRRFPRSRRAPFTKAPLCRTAAAHPAGPHELSDEEVSSLAEQLAEARHEEVSAKAEADAELGMLEEELPHGPEGAAEAEEFIAEAEAEEHEDQAEHDERHDEHEEHEQAPDIAAEGASGLGEAEMREPAGFAGAPHVRAHL